MAVRNVACHICRDESLLLSTRPSSTLTALTPGTPPALPAAPHRTSPAAAVARQGRLNSDCRHRCIARASLKGAGDPRADREPRRSLHSSSAELWSL